MYTHALIKDNVDLRYKFRQNVDKLENDISPLLMLEDSSLKAVKLAIEGKVNYEYVTYLKHLNNDSQREVKNQKSVLDGNKKKSFARKTVPYEAVSDHL